MIELYNFQRKAIEDIQQAMRAGYKRILYVLPCGGGKTVISGEIAKMVTNNGKYLRFAVHRDELRQQTALTYQNMGVDFSKAEISMVQTISKKIKQMHKSDVLIIDECFPKGTLIDGTPIEKIKIGDYVNSFNHKTNTIEKKKVINIFTNTIKHDLISINGMVCTENHPIYDAKNGVYKNAKYFKSGDYILQKLSKINEQTRNDKQPKSLLISSQICLLLQKLHKKILRKENRLSNISELQRMSKHYNVGEHGKISKRQTQVRRKCLLLQSLFNSLQKQNKFNYNDTNKQNICKQAYEKQQSYETRRNSRKSISNFKKDRSQAVCMLRKWLRINNSTGNNVKCFNFGKFKRNCGIFNTNKTNEKHKLSNLLQSGHRASSIYDCNRIRWKFSWTSFKTIRRQEKRQSFRIVRVDSIEVQKQTIDGTFGGLCPDGKVYNIEVEDNNNYFVNNILVHNCHHAVAEKTYGGICEHTDYLIGISATPCKFNGSGLGEYFDIMITGPSVKELINIGKLSSFRYYASDTLDLSDIGIQRGEYNQKQLSGKMEHEIVYKDTVKMYNKHTPNTKAIIYNVSIESAMRTALEFENNGIKASYLSGKTPKKERANIVESFRQGKIDILCNCSLFEEGFDCPDCETVMLLRKTKSLRLHIQQCMRGMRIDKFNPNKIAKIVDCVGNYIEHGLPDDDRKWTLEKKQNKKGDAPVKVCPVENCETVCNAGVSICPNCGYQFPFEEKPAADITQIVDMTEILRAKKHEYYKQCKTWGELELFRKAKGYKTFWSIFKAEEMNIEMPIGKQRQLEYLQRKQML